MICLTMSHVVDRATVKSIRVAILAGERAGRLSRAFQKQFERATVVRHENIKRRNAGAALAISVVTSGPTDGEACGAGDRRQCIDAAGWKTCVDCVHKQALDDRNVDREDNPALRLDS